MGSSLVGCSADTVNSRTDNSQFPESVICYSKNSLRINPFITGQKHLRLIMGSRVDSRPIACPG